MVADILHGAADVRNRDAALAGHNAVAVVEHAERQVFAVVDVVHEQLFLGDFAGIRPDLRTCRACRS